MVCFGMAWATPDARHQTCASLTSVRSARCHLASTRCARARCFLVLGRKPAHLHGTRAGSQVSSVATMKPSTRPRSYLCRDTLNTAPKASKCPAILVEIHLSQPCLPTVGLRHTSSHRGTFIIQGLRVALRLLEVRCASSSMRWPSDSGWPRRDTAQKSTGNPGAVRNLQASCTTQPHAQHFRWTTSATPTSPSDRNKIPHVCPLGWFGQASSIHLDSRRC